MVSKIVKEIFEYWDILCQLTPFSAFFGRPSPILLKFGMFVGRMRKCLTPNFKFLNQIVFDICMPKTKVESLGF